MSKIYSAIKGIALIILTLLLANSSIGQIAQRGVATTATTTNTSLVIAKPAGVVQGDVMIVDIAQGNNNTTNPTSAGWILVDGRSLLGGTLRYGAVLYKVAGAAEP